MTVEPGSTRWKQLVASCRKKDAAALWAIGDAALEIAPIGRAGAKSSVFLPLEQFALDIERGFDRVLALRGVASAFPPGKRLDGVSVKAHEVLSAPAHRRKIRPGMTLNDAMDKAGHVRTARQSVEEVKASRSPAAIAAAVADDPAVADAVMADRKAKVALSQAHLRTRERELDELYPERLTNPADIKAMKASNREALQPLVNTLANMKVVAAIYAAAEAIRASTPDEALMAQIDEALDDVNLARHEIDFRRANA